tara:strand:- start:224 stop:589 length:366 start_codon:yes stop_codon:yes gene_type:complete
VDESLYVLPERGWMYPDFSNEVDLAIVVTVFGFVAGIFSVASSFILVFPSSGLMFMVFFAEVDLAIVVTVFGFVTGIFSVASSFILVSVFFLSGTSNFTIPFSSVVIKFQFSSLAINCFNS